MFPFFLLHREQNITLPQMNQLVFKDFQNFQNNEVLKSHKPKKLFKHLITYSI